MKVNKKVLGDLERVYATTIMKEEDGLKFLVATEGHGPCLLYNEKEEVTTVWDGPGGTMNVVLIPGRPGEFIATQHFFPTFDAKESRIVYGSKKKDGLWDITPIMVIPYLHRFDIIDINGELYFIGATLCTEKAYKEDWSNPGKVYVGKLSEDLTEPFEIRPIFEGITKNHGFCNAKWEGRRAVLISGSEGVFVLYVPQNGNNEWECEQIFCHEVSDVAVCDIDGDGELEIATIEGFHGDKGMIYKNIGGKLTPIAEYEFEFGHVIWGGILLNQPTFIIGGRKGKMELVAFQMDGNQEIRSFVIDNTGGPSNIAVYSEHDHAVILAANRQIGEIALYELTV